MPRHAQPKDNTLLEMAIVGYQHEAERVKAKIADIKARLGQPGPGRPKATIATASAATAPYQAPPAKRRTMSKAGRARIAAAQRARWAARKKQQAQPAKPAEIKKRKLSAARFEGHQGSHEETLGGLPQGTESCGVNADYSAKNA